MKALIQTENAPKAIGPYSQAVKYGQMTFLSGQIALDATTGNLITDNITIETHKVLSNIKAVLEAAKLNINNVVKCSIFLKNMSDFEKVNEVYGAFFNAPYPARETVEVSRLPKDVNIEISVIAMAD